MFWEKFEEISKILLKILKVFNENFEGFRKILIKFKKNLKFIKFKNLKFIKLKKILHVFGLSVPPGYGPAYS